MIQRLAQFTDIQAALVVGGLSLQAQAATLRAQPEIVVATPVRRLPFAPVLMHCTDSGIVNHCHLGFCATRLPARSMFCSLHMCACCRAAPLPTVRCRQRSGARATLRLFRLPLLLTSVPLCSTCAHPLVSNDRTLLVGDLHWRTC